MLGRVLKEVKLPFPDDFFPEMELAPALQNDLAASATRLLENAMRDESPATRFHPSQRPDQWKLVGDRTGLQLYRERGVAKGNAVRVNVLGHLMGSLHDVMLGLYAKDNNSFKTQRAIMHSDYLDAAVLHVLDADPYSEDDTGFSFQFSGIKWMASSPSGKLVNKRDMCWFEQMGITNDEAGDEIGFLVMQSVRVEACPPFEQQGLKRSTASVCYLFRPLPNGRVSVFMIGEHSVGGKARSWSADAVMVEMWLGMASIMECAQAKRLSKLVCSKEMFIASAPSKSCDVCDGKMKTGKNAQNCKICGKNICDRCRMSKLIYPTRNTGNFPCSYAFCKPCLSDAKDRLFGKVATRVSFHSSADSSNSASPRGYRSMPRPGGSMMSSNSSGSDHFQSVRNQDNNNRSRTSSQDLPTYSWGGRPVSPRSSNASSNLSARGTVSSDPSSYGRPIHLTSPYNGPMHSTPGRHASDGIGSIHNIGHRANQPPPARPAGRSIDGRIPGPPGVRRNTSDSSARRVSNPYQSHQSQTQMHHAPVSTSSNLTSNGSFRSGVGTSMSSGYTTSGGTLSFDSMYDVENNDAYRSNGRGGYTSEESDYSDVDDEITIPSSSKRPVNIYEADDNDVIELARDSEEPAQPVDVFEQDGLKYINTFRTNDGATPSSASSGGAANATDNLMERLMQINMAAEATYLMAKYNANIQENLQR